MVNKLALVMVLFLLVLPLAVAPDVDLASRVGHIYPDGLFDCVPDEDECAEQCVEVGRPEEYCYCNEEAESCFYESDRYTADTEGGGDDSDDDEEGDDEDQENQEEEDNQTEGINIYAEDFAEFQSRLEDVEATQEEETQSTTRRLVALETDSSRVQQQLTLIRSDLDKIKSSLDKGKKQSQTLATGQASLQKKVVGVGKDLDVIQEDLEAEKSFTSFMKWTLFLLVAIAVGLGVYYFLVRKKMHPGHKFGSQITDYINKHIRKGRKYPYIKHALTRAGWIEADIKKAYDAVVRHNYQKYKQQTSKQQTSSPKRVGVPRIKSTKPVHNKKKVAVISIIGIIMMVGMFFIVKGVTGQAIEYKKLVDGAENNTIGKVTYNVSCTPPHLINPLGDACCLDADNSSVCDDIEARLDEDIEQVAEGERCTDNIQCPAGQYCIDKVCASIASLYEEDVDDCDRRCDAYYGTTISTNNNETYALRPNQGSYTAAGALEWKPLAGVRHCFDEETIVPINIIEKNNGEVILEYVIALAHNETSNLIVHSEIESAELELGVNRVDRLCDEPNVVR